MEKIGIVGDSDYSMAVVRKFLQTLDYNNVIIITGKDDGLESSVYEIALRNRFKVELVDVTVRDGYTKIQARKVRDRDIVLAVDKMYIFWDGANEHTKRIVKLVRIYNKEHVIIYPD